MFYKYIRLQIQCVFNRILNAYEQCIRTDKRNDS